MFTQPRSKVVFVILWPEVSDARCVRNLEEQTLKVHTFLIESVDPNLCICLPKRRTSARLKM